MSFAMKRWAVGGLDGFVTLREGTVRALMPIRDLEAHVSSARPLMNGGEGPYNRHESLLRRSRVRWVRLLNSDRACSGARLEPAALVVALELHFETVAPDVIDLPVASRMHSELACVALQCDSASCAVSSVQNVDASGAFQRLEELAPSRCPDGPDLCITVRDHDECEGYDDESACYMARVVRFPALPFRRK